MAPKHRLSKPVIMQILPRLHSGGVEKIVVDIAGFLASIDQKPTYVVSAGGGLVEELTRRHVTHITLPVAGKNPFTIIFNGFRLARLGRRLGVDLFHVQSRAPAWSTLIASKLSGIPYISTYHGAYRNKGRLSNWYNSAMVRGRCVITVSDFIGAIVQKDHGARNPRLIKIYPGIDTESFSPDRFSPEDIQEQKQKWQIPLDKPVLLVIGRIAPTKRFDLAIEALAQIDRQDAYLVMAGSDQGRTQLTESLLQLAKDRGVADRVRLVQDFPNLPLAYAVSDCVLFPTQHIETYGRISAEAGAMGKIIIAATMGAVAELIKDGETGFLMAPGDLDALVRLTNHVLSLSPKERQKIEQAAIHHVLKNFSASRMYTQTLEVYQNMIGEEKKNIKGVVAYSG